MKRAYEMEKNRIIQEHLNGKEWFLKLMRLNDTNCCQDHEAEYSKWLSRSLERLDNKFKECLETTREINTKHMWICINPVTINQGSMKLYKKLFDIDNNWRWEACVEQNTKEGIRAHIHMILYDNIRPNRVIKKLAELFDCQTNFIQCKTSYELSRNKKYIRGDKAREKMPRACKDRKDRKPLNIPDIFFSKELKDREKTFEDGKYE